MKKECIANSSVINDSRYLVWANCFVIVTLVAYKLFKQLSQLVRSLNVFVESVIPAACGVKTTQNTISPLFFPKEKSTYSNH